MMNATNHTVCVQGYPWEFFVYIPLSTVSFLANVLLFLATVTNRKKLQRQSYIYACVISSLLCNIVFVILHICIVIDGYLGHDFETGKSFKTIWTLCQSAVVSIQFIMCGNILALLYVVLDSTYFVGRSVNRKASEFAEDFDSTAESANKRRWMFSAKRRRAIFFIVSAWVIPTCFVIASTASWNCSDSCIYCGGGLAKEDVCPGQTSCSRTWAPVHINYLVAHLILWFTEVLLLIICILWGIHSFWQVMAPPSNDSNSFVENENSNKRLGPQIKPPYVTQTSYTIKLNEDIKQQENVEVNSDKEGFESSTLKQANAEKKQSIRKATFRLHSRIIFMIVMSGTFVFCTLPLIISFFIDIFSIDVQTTTILTFTTVFIYIYTICCPLILLKFLPNLKLVLSSMISNCSCQRWRKLYRRQSYKKKTDAHRMSTR